MRETPATAMGDSPRRPAGKAAVVLVAAIVAACSGASSQPPAPTSPPPNAAASASASAASPSAPAASPSAPASIAPSPESPNPAPSTTATGPATARITLTGDAAATKALANPSISCQFPRVSGLQINIFGTAVGDPEAVMLDVAPGTLSVSLRAGQGATYTERDFSGTGVTGFDAAHGATLSGSLTEVTAAGGKVGTLGAVTAIAGTIDCGGQEPGSSTIRLTGTLPEGAVDGPLNPVRVGCGTYAGGRNISATGIVTVGATPALVDVNVTSAGGFTVFFATSPTTHYLTSTAKGSGVLTGATTATVSGDAVSTGASGAEPVTIHAAGSDTCGSTGAN